MKALDWLEDFFFKYFSSSTSDTKDSWVRYVVFGIMCIPFIAGIWFAVMGFINFALFFGKVLSIMLIPFAIIWIVVYFYHNYKLKKLQKRWK